jgi:3-dehydroquinate synthase
MMYPEFVDNINNFTKSATATRMVFLIDRNVHKHYESLFEEYDIIIVPPGEHSKSLTLIDELASTLIDMGYQKDSLLVGVGGGVVTDIAGFVSSVFMRGMPFGLIPTTLLAMSDAALGGKNGVNAGGIKNCVGTIRQPEFIAVWPGFLKTLPDIEFHNGMAEIIKHALLEGDEFVQFLFDNSSEISEKDEHILIEMIQRSAKLKLSIVEQDKFDNDKRHLLNLGHTIAHALETVSSSFHTANVLLQA